MQSCIFDSMRVLSDVTGPLTSVGDVGNFYNKYDTIREELICCQESGYVLIKGKLSYRLGDNLSVVLHENLLENHVLASPAA